MKKYQYHDFNEKTLFLKEKDMTVMVEALGDKVFHVFSEKAKDFPSYAVEETFVPIPMKTREENGSRIFYTKELALHLDAEGHFDFCDKEDKMICQMYRQGITKREKLGKDFFEVLVSEGHVVMEESEDTEVQMAFHLDEHDCVYGLGDKTGFLNKRHYDYEMWNTDNPSPQEDNFKALYKTIPFYMVLKEEIAYGIFFDNHFKSYFDLGKKNPECLSFEAEGGALDFYFFVGKDLKEVLTAYTDLTGRTPLPQLWTLGYHQSRWGYRTESDMRELAANMKKFEIPCDAIHFDIDYMEGYRVFTWNQERYDNVEKTLADLKDMGIKAVTIVDPGVKVDAGYYVYDEGLEKGYFAKDNNNLTYVNRVWPGDSVYPDYGREEVRRWWGKKHKFLLDKGVSGIWNDMNEPAGFNGPLPDDVIFYDGEKPSTHKAMHNVYGHNMSRATFAGLQKLKKERPFVITRACYSGTQKYAIVWTGDNHSIWSHLRMAIPQLCNLGLSGIAFAGTDVGGFGSDTTPELFTRWFQVGCFSPLFRNHSALATLNQEPWCFGEKVLRDVLKYIRLRYELLPYMYDQFYQTSLNGLPPMRPVVLNYPFDKEVRNQNDQFMVGDQLLVSPVVEQGATKKMVYLPEGVWYCYWSGAEYQGGKHYIVDAPIDHCPIFVKQGSILPKYPVYSSVSEQKDDVLILEVFGDEASYVHYQDNGSDYEYKDGKYNRYEFCYQNGELITQMEHENYPKYKEIKVVKRA